MLKDVYIKQFICNSQKKGFVIFAINGHALMTVITGKDFSEIEYLQHVEQTLWTGHSNPLCLQKTSLKFALIISRNKIYCSFLNPFCICLCVSLSLSRLAFKFAYLGKLYLQYREIVTKVFLKIIKRRDLKTFKSSRGRSAVSKTFVSLFSFAWWDRLGNDVMKGES